MRRLDFKDLVLPLRQVAELASPVRSRLERLGYPFTENGYVDGLGPADYLELELDNGVQIGFEYLTEASVIVLHSQQIEASPRLQLELLRSEIEIPDADILATYDRW